MAGRLGAKIDLTSLPVETGASGTLSSGVKLFSESQSRFVITVTPQYRAAFEALFNGAGSGAASSPASGSIAFARVGEITSGSDLEIRDAVPDGAAIPGAAGSTLLFSAGMDEMFAQWRRPLDW